MKPKTKFPRGKAKSYTAMLFQQIKTQIRHAPSEYEKESLEKRLSALAGKVAIIKVGGATETEINEKKDRVDDAVAATKAAVAEGIVAGGGVTLVNLTRILAVPDKGAMKAHTPVGDISYDMSVTGKHVSWIILAKAMYQPFIQIMNNAGLNGDALLQQVGSAEDGIGFNVLDLQAGLISMKDAGIVDPAKVTREALQNAVSVAGTAMTMGSLIVELPEEKPAGGGAGGGMPGMGGMGMDY